MTEAFVGFGFGLLLATLVASGWSYDYQFVEEAVQVAVENCGEGNISGIVFGDQEVSCKDGRTIHWSSEK